MLRREDIAAAVDLKTMTLAVPEWGGEVRLRELTLGEREDWSKEAVDSGTGHIRSDVSMSRIMALLCAMSLVDEADRPIFESPEDGTAVLLGKDANAVQAIFDAALKLNGLRSEDVESAAKNS